MDIATTETTETATEEYPSTIKTVVITVAATAVTVIASRLVLRRHFKKATEEALVVETPQTTPVNTEK